jgi:histidinol dehydrogenase
MRWFKYIEPSKVIASLYDEFDVDMLDASERVQTIIQTVKKEGDDALRRYSHHFDGVDLVDLRVDPAVIEAAYESVDKEFKDALDKAYHNIKSYHEKQQYNPIEVTIDGVYQGQKITPIERVGLYVPGGSASYPSSVLMSAIPALVAGVKRRVVVTPPHPDGLSPYVLAALYRCGCDEVYQVGGAQAIAALAYGTQTIPKVDKIVGPGNLYVALAKQQLSGLVGIDGFAGPSEVMIFADRLANPEWIAADLMAQAEHDVVAKAMVVSTDEDLLTKVEAALKRFTPQRQKKETIEAALRDHGALILVDSHASAYAMIEACAPEHLEIITSNPEAHLPWINHAGAIFLGPYTPEAMGDYIGGPNHTLPTNGTARFSSGLSTYDFQKRTSILRYTKERFAEDANAVIRLADAEGLEAHAFSVMVRKE